jgi:hypothetical protein
MATKRKDFSTVIVFKGDSAVAFSKSMKRDLNGTQKKTLDKSVGVYDYYQAKWTSQQKA